MHLTTDVTTYDNYKAWVAMQASEPPGLSNYKRTQVLMNESQKKKNKNITKKNGLIDIVFRLFMLCFSF